MIGNGCRGSPITAPMLLARGPYTSRLFTIVAEDYDRRVRTATYQSHIEYPYGTIIDLIFCVQNFVFQSTRRAYNYPIAVRT